MVMRRLENEISKKELKGLGRLSQERCRGVLPMAARCWRTSSWRGGALFFHLVKNKAAGSSSGYL